MRWNAIVLAIAGCTDPSPVPPMQMSAPPGPPAGDRFLCKFLDLSPTEHAVIELRVTPSGTRFETFLRMPRADFEAFGPVQ